jgi:hypothetical protein
MSIKLLHQTAFRCRSGPLVKSGVKWLSQEG